MNPIWGAVMAGTLLAGAAAGSGGPDGTDGRAESWVADAVESPFADGLTDSEALPATGEDTAAPLEALVPPRLGLRMGMPRWRVLLARPGLRHDGEGSRPERPLWTESLSRREGGGDLGAAFVDGRLDEVFLCWSGECAFSAACPGPVRDDLRDALARLGAPSCRRMLVARDGIRHYWAWTKGDCALVFEITRLSAPEGRLVSVMAVVRRNSDPESLWALGVADGNWGAAFQSPDFTAAIPEGWPYCPPFIDAQAELAKGFLVVEAVKPCHATEWAGVRPGDVFLSWGTERSVAGETLLDDWLSFMEWKRSAGGPCWFAREGGGGIQVFSCDVEMLFECHAALGTFCLRLKPTMFSRGDWERFRVAAEAAGTRADD